MFEHFVPPVEDQMAHTLVKVVLKVVLVFYLLN